MKRWVAFATHFLTFGSRFYMNLEEQNLDPMAKKWVTKATYLSTYIPFIESILNKYFFYVI